MPGVRVWEPMIKFEDESCVIVCEPMMIGGGGMVVEVEVRGSEESGLCVDVGDGI